MEDEENMFVIRGPVEEYGEIPAKGYFEYKPTSSQMGSTTINEEIKENIVSSTSQNVPSVSNQESASFKEGEKPSSNLKFNQEMDVHKTNKNGGLSKDGFYKDMTFSQTHNHQPLNVEKMEKEKEEEEKEKEKENDVSQKKMPTFIEKSQKKLVVLNDSLLYYDNFLAYLKENFGDLIELESLEILISFQIDDLQFHQLSYYIEEKLQYLKDLISLKLKIMDSTLSTLNLYKICSNLPKNLQNLKLIIISQRELTLEGIFPHSQFKDLEKLKIWIKAPNNPLIKINQLYNNLKCLTLSFSSLFSDENFNLSLKNLQKVETLINEDNEKNIEKLFKNNQCIRSLKLTFLNTKSSGNLLKYMKDLKVLKKLQISFDEKVEFSSYILMEILAIFLDKDSEPFQDLLTFKLQIPNYYPDSEKIKSNCLQMDFKKIFPKIQTFLVNSIDLCKFFTQEQLETQAFSFKNSELIDSLRLLLKSKTMLLFLSDESFKKSEVFNCFNLEIEALIDKFIKLDNIFELQEKAPKSKNLQFTLENSNTLTIYLRLLSYFRTATPELEEFFLYFTLDSDIDNAVFENYSLANNLNVHFSIAKEKEAFGQWEFTSIPRIRYFKLFFKHCLRFGELFLYSLNSEKAQNWLPDMKSFCLSFIEEVASLDNQLILPVNFFSEKLDRIFLSAENINFKGNIKEKGLLMNFFKYLNSIEAKNQLHSIELLLKNCGIVNFYDDFEGFFKALSKSYEKLRHLRFQIPGLQVQDEDFQQRFLLLNLKSLKSLDLNLESTGISSKTMRILADFIGTNKFLESLSLMLRNNTIMDLSGLFKVITKDNLPNLKSIKLYLHKTQLSNKTLENLGTSLSHFPEEVTDFKIDLEDNKLTSENKDLFSQIAKGLGHKFKKLKSLQFHMVKCQLGKLEILEFLREIYQIKAENLLFFDLGKNKAFWESEWSPSELEMLSEALERDFQTPKLRLEFTALKNYKKNPTLFHTLEKIQGKPRKNLELKMKF